MLPRYMGYCSKTAALVITFEGFDSFTLWLWSWCLANCTSTKKNRGKICEYCQFSQRVKVFYFCLTLTLFSAFFLNRSVPQRPWQHGLLLPVGDLERKHKWCTPSSSGEGGTLRLAGCHGTNGSVFVADLETVTILGQFNLIDRLSSLPTPQKLACPNSLYFVKITFSWKFWCPTPVFIFQMLFQVRNIKNTC
jgi:hypothetical protein